jgi:hypothetical protein
MASADAKCRCDSDNDRVKTAMTRAEGGNDEGEDDFKSQVSGCLLSGSEFEAHTSTEVECLGIGNNK